MRLFFSLALIGFFSTFSAQSVITFPYNPDSDGDAFVATADMLETLSAFGSVFTPAEIQIDGVGLLQVIQDLQNQLAVLQQSIDDNALPDGILSGDYLIWNGTAWMPEHPVDDCGVLNGDNSTCTDCCGVVNGDGSTCDGACGACNDDTSCLDDCGVLNGDNSTCLEGCMDPLACDYDPSAAIQAVTAISGTGSLSFTWLSVGDYASEISWAVDGTTYAAGDTPALTLPVGTYTITGYDSYGDGWDGGELLITDDVSGTSVTFVVTGSSSSVSIDVTESGGVLICDYACNGCMDATACNYDATATIDDGSCATDDLCGVCGGDNSTCTDCLGILNGDGLVSHGGYDYSTVQIGDQCWFAENCRYLPVVSPSSEGNTTDPYYYVYGYEGTDVITAQAQANYSTYGVLYNWPAVMEPGICPSNWHIPTDLEWQTMEIALGMSALEASSTGWRGTDQGSQMKFTSGWVDNGNGSNSSGFTGLPGGYRYSGGFSSSGNYGYWWSASESGSYSWRRKLSSYNDDVNRVNGSRFNGFSARCVRD